MEWGVILGFLALAWLISPIILLIALIVARRQVRELRQQPVARSAPASLIAPPPVRPELVGGSGHYALADLENLLLLRLELQRLADAGVLEQERHRQLSDELDQLWEQHLRRGGMAPNSEAWRLRRAMAWNLLARESDTAPGAPPWQPAALTPSVKAPSPLAGEGWGQATPSPLAGEGRGGG